MTCLHLKVPVPHRTVLVDDLLRVVVPKLFLELTILLSIPAPAAAEVLLTGIAPLAPASLVTF